MTSGEFKFALQVEGVLNLIPQPEYRQLMVEGMMVITMLVEVDTYAKLDLNQIIQIDKLVHEANVLYLKDQVRFFFFFTGLYLKKKWQCLIFSILCCVEEYIYFILVI